MERNAIKRWVGACLLGSAVTTGCSQVGSRVQDPAPRVASSYAPPRIGGAVIAQRKVEESPAQVVQSLPPPDTLPLMASEDKNTVQDPSTTQASSDSSNPGLVGEPDSVRKALVDITAHRCFNHTEDYQSLTGQLQHSHITKAWRLRYASVDEVDPYGGSVTLTDDARLSERNDGDFVRVHGRLMNPEARGIAPLFAIDSIQSIDKKE
jgi:hypothetical protein